MRKCMALFLALLMLLGACSAAAEALPSGDVYSVEAADEFCNAWDQYFAEQGIPLSVGYNLAEGQDRIERLAKGAKVLPGKRFGVRAGEKELMAWIAGLGLD